MAGGWALSSELCLEFPHCSASEPGSFSQVLSLGVTSYSGGVCRTPEWNTASRKKVVYLNGVRHPGLCSDHPDSVLDR